MKHSTNTECLPYVTNACEKSSVRIIKLVRLCLDTAKPLLQRDPSLKLVQLLRDPRGIVYSRLVKTRWYSLFVKNGNYTPVLRHVKLLCKRMLIYYEAGIELVNMFPGKVKLIRYEDLLTIM